jgi:hypothetical protein
MQAETMARRMVVVEKMLKTSPEGLTASDVVKERKVNTKREAIDVFNALMAAGRPVWAERGYNGQSTYFMDFIVDEGNDALTEARRVDNFYRQILDPSQHKHGDRLLSRKDWNGIGGSYVELPKGVYC